MAEQPTLDELTSSINALRYQLGDAIDALKTASQTAGQLELNILRYREAETKKLKAILYEKIAAEEVNK